ncbi:MAG: nucleotide pyrophosphohydrolase [Phascolarctobacterium sp.]|nr:nucleotide pyrophosphohydrolase [Phascolarctobacterium sp.]
METIESIQEKIVKFRDDRNWQQFHNPKDLAISLSLEAAELLEVFQWSGTDTSAQGKKEKIAEELADVMLYALLMADATGLDVKEIMLKKIARNCEKYPVEKSYGSSKKYTEL